MAAFAGGPLVQGVLLVHGRGLPAAERSAFLSVFTRVAPARQDEEESDLTWAVEDDPLLEEIDAFVADLASGTYCDGFGWDPDIRDERSFGDESWVGEMDDLFGGAQDAFLAGSLGLARAAYQRLLGAFALEEQGEAFCGPEPAVQMVTTDLPEAAARYLRAVYETTPAGQRAAVLVGVWADLPTAGPSLAAVGQTRRSACRAGGVPRVVDHPAALDPGRSPPRGAPACRGRAAGRRPGRAGRPGPRP